MKIVAKTRKIDYAGSNKIEFDGQLHFKTFVEDAFSPGTVAANSSDSLVVAVPLAEIGDLCLVSYDQDLAETVMTAYVTAAGFVTALLTNATSAGIAVPDGTVRVWLIKST